jgi:hypothetical protein
MKMVASKMTHRNAYPYSDPILEATVMLPGPKTTDAMMNPGPTDLAMFRSERYMK